MTGATGEPQRILVIKLGALGDFIQALGPMAAIRRHHRNAHISLLTTRPYAGFAEESGYCDSVLIDEKPGLLNPAGWLSLRKALAGGRFERVYDLQNNDRTAFYLWLLKSGGSAPEWVGAAPGASHRNTSPSRTAGHAFDGHVQTLKLAGISNIEVDRLEWMKADLSSFPLRPPYVLLVPGCSPQHPQKRWPAEKYGRLAKILSSARFQPVIIGGKDETQIAQTILRACPEALDLTGQTSFRQIAVMARIAAGAIGNDTGPMHMIASTGCSCLALFSASSNPVRHAPKGAQAEILRRETLADLDVEEVIQAFAPLRLPIAEQAATMH